MLLLPLPPALLLLLPPPLPPVRPHTRRYVQLAPGSGRADDRLERAGSVAADQLLSPSIPPSFLGGQAASPPSWVCGLPIFPSATSSAVAMSLSFCGSEVAIKWL